MCPTLAGLRTRLLELSKSDFTWEEISQMKPYKGIPKATLWGIAHGEPVPNHWKDQLDLKDPALEYTRNRRARLNEIARKHGWKSWSEYETNVLRGLVWEIAKIKRTDRPCPPKPG